MNKVLLRKIYPLISNDKKNIKWRKITDFELDCMVNQTQKLANCYLVSARQALCASEKGRALLKNRIFVQDCKRDDPAYKFVFSVEGKNEAYRVDRLDYYQKFYKIFNTYADELMSGNMVGPNKGMPNIAMDIAISKMVSKHPKEKSWYLRLYKQPLFENLRCENNRPSKAFEWLTGIKPTVIISQEGYKDNLSNHNSETLEVLNKLSQLDSEDYSFIAMTGSQKFGHISKWHCLPILWVNKGIELLDKRTDIGYNFTPKNFIDSFKSIVGIIWKEVD